MPEAKIPSAGRSVRGSRQPPSPQRLLEEQPVTATGGCEVTASIKTVHKGFLSGESYVGRQLKVLGTGDLAQARGWEKLGLALEKLFK